MGLLIVLGWLLCGAAAVAWMWSHMHRHFGSVFEGDLPFDAMMMFASAFTFAIGPIGLVAVAIVILVWSWP